MKAPLNWGGSRVLIDRRQERVVEFPCMVKCLDIGEHQCEGDYLPVLDAEAQS